MYFTDFEDAKSQKSISSIRQILLWLWYNNKMKIAPQKNRFIEFLFDHVLSQKNSNIDWESLMP